MPGVTDTRRFIGVAADGGTYYLKRGGPAYPRLYKLECFKCGVAIENKQDPHTCKRNELNEEKAIQEAREDVHRWAALQAFLLYKELTYTNWLRTLEIVGHVSDESTWTTLNPWIDFLKEQCKPPGNKRWYANRIGELAREVCEVNRYDFLRKMIEMPTMTFTGHKPKCN